jgi:EmrB/QacA subfamily drug resistance transporter
MAAIMIGTIMVVLDSTVVNVALHAIGVDLNAGNGIEWVVTAYLLGVCASQPATGWLSDRFGRKELYLTSLMAFTAASLLCAASGSLPVLVAARALQGLGGGALLPVGMAMCLDIFPQSQHGRAIAMWGMSAMAAPALGPTLGGWVVTSVTWHWLFLVNVPIGVVCVLLGFRVLPRTGERRHLRFDALGLVLGVSGLVLTVLGLSEANQWGWASPPTVACLVVGLAALWLFVLHERSTKDPLIELRMLNHRAFRLTLVIVLFVYFAHFGRIVYLALELTSLRGYTPLRVGVMFMPAAIAAGISMQIGGRMCDRIGPRLPIMTGLAFVLGATVSLGLLTLGTPAWVIVAIMCVQGFGTGLTTAPMMVAGLSQMPKELLSQGAAMRTLTNQIAGAVSVAVLGAVVATRVGDQPSPSTIQAAYNSAFLVAAAGIVIALVFTSRLPRGVPDLDQDTREVERETEALVLMVD